MHTGKFTTLNIADGYKFLVPGKKVQSSIPETRVLIRGCKTCPYMHRALKLDCSIDPLYA